MYFFQPNLTNEGKKDKEPLFFLRRVERGIGIL